MATQTDILQIKLQTSGDGKVKASLAGVSKEVKGIDTSTDGLNKRLGFATLGVAAIAAGAGFLGAKIISTTAEFEKLNASLKTVTGSQEAATRAMDMIKEMASDTPFSVQELTESFIKLKALGLDPSEEALVSYGNTASAMGKNLNDMIEAVADASTGEFERLKEFGIKARQQGDEVSLTFQGVTTTIGNNSQEIQKYLLDIGNTQFAGAMEEQMDTLNGAFSNLGDSTDRLMVAIGNSGLGNAVKDSTKELSNMTSVIAENIEKMGFFEGALSGVIETIHGDEVERSITAVNKEINQLEAELSALERHKKESSGQGLLHKWIHGDEGEIDQQIEQTNKKIKEMQQLLFGLRNPPKVNTTGTESNALTGNGKGNGDNQTGELTAQEKAMRDYAKSLAEAQLQEDLFFDKQAAIDAQFVSGNIGAEVYRAELERLSNEAFPALGDALGEAGEATKKVEEDADKMGAALNNAVTGWAAGFSSTLTDLVWDAEASFDSILESFGKMLTQMVIQQAVVNPMLQKMGFTTANAHGNVFSGGQVQAFASGGVVGGATYFPMAGGNTGLMGEAGPEAIMPLARLPNGDLGIKAQDGGGGGTVVQVIDQRSAAQPKAEVSSSRGADGTEFVRVIIREVKQGLSGGLFDREMSSNFGMSRRGS